MDLEGDISGDGAGTGTEAADKPGISDAWSHVERVKRGVTVGEARMRFAELVEFCKRIGIDPGHVTKAEVVAGSEAWLEVVHEIPVEGLVNRIRYTIDYVPAEPGAIARGE